jgi:hypothetical protein
MLARSKSKSTTPPPSEAQVDRALAGDYTGHESVNIGGQVIPCDVVIHDHHGTVTYHFPDGEDRSFPVDLEAKNGRLTYHYHLPDGTIYDWSPTYQTLEGLGKSSK